MKGIIMKSIACTVIVLLVSACLATATIIHVPGDYSTIQAGINAAFNGDTVLVADGTYTGTGNLNINFGGREILVISENGPDNCIIDCRNSGRGFYFGSGETVNSILSGFTITNGSATGTWAHGGGIYCDGSDPTIENCIISRNTCSGTWGFGGGIRCEDASPTISYCTITDNLATGTWGFGGGINCEYDSYPIISHCIIYGNTAGQSIYGFGGGISCMSSAAPIIINCTVSGNSVIGSTAGHGGGIYCDDAEPAIVNTIVEGNSGGGGIYFDNSPQTSVIFSDFNANGGGNFTGSVPPGLGQIVTVNYNGDPCDQYYNILLNPLFVDPSSGNFNLQAGSPCVDAGDPDSPPDSDFTIADIGGLYYDQGFTPLLFVTLTPQNPPIQIPAGGGNFQFDILIENNSATGVMFDGWTMAVLPDSSIFGPIILRTGIYLAAGGTILREDMTQFVPAGAPSGSYIYAANVGIYPDIVIDSDFFLFEKLPGFDASNHDYGWAVYGWDGEESPIISTPSEFALYDPYPNPFNPETTIAFELPKPGEVSLVVYDIQGREVSRLIDGWQSAGVHEAVFSGSELASGVYFALLQAGDFQQTRKLLLVK